MNADGTGSAEPHQQPGEPTASRRGRPTAGRSPSRAPATASNTEIYVMNADGTDPAEAHQQPGGRRQPRLAAAAAAPPEDVRQRSLQLNRATVEGTLTETGPGTGCSARARAASCMWAGSELRPRFGGRAGRGHRTRVELREEGAGVEVLFGRFEVPLERGARSRSTCRRRRSR